MVKLQIPNHISPGVMISKLYAWSFSTTKTIGNSTMHFPERFSANDSLGSSSKNFWAQPFTFSAEKNYTYNREVLPIPSAAIWAVYTGD